MVGVVIKREKIKQVHTSKGKDQMQVKLKITDGKYDFTYYDISQPKLWIMCLKLKFMFLRTRMTVTFWDNMAEEFQNEIDTVKHEYPLILIVASGKISKWKGMAKQLNYSFYSFCFINFSNHVSN